MKRLRLEEGEEVLAVIVNSSDTIRTYWEGDFDPDEREAPTCWSPDNTQPSDRVPQDKKQASRCMDCKQNIRGSGSNGGRACRFSKRLAVVLEGDLEEVRSLHIPASSWFGKNFEAPFRGLKEYALFLHNRQATSVALFTRVTLNCDGTFPVIVFAPKRPLEEEELDIVKDIIGSDDALEAIDIDAFTGNTDSESPFEVEEGFTQDSIGELSYDD